MRKITRIFLILGMVLTIAFSAVGCTSAFVNSPDQSTGSTGGTSAGGGTTTEYGGVTDFSGITLTKPSTANREELELTQAVKKAENSVVGISIDIGDGHKSQASGVIIDMDIGANDLNTNLYILTCFHVVEDKGDITVFLPDENNVYERNDYTYTGKIGGKFTDNAGEAVTLVGGDMPSDIALLKLDITKNTKAGTMLDRSKITEAVFAPDSYSPQKGEQVFAIGNPLGIFMGWCDVGVISKLNVSTDVSDIGTMELLGINVDTTHGSSGGGLFNMYGELIGITNAGRTDANGKNFAIPLYTSARGVAGKIDNGVINIVTQLAGTYTSDNYGYVPNRRDMFGFTITLQRDANTNLEYIQVIEVVANSVADRAGLIVDDVIVGYEKGTDVNTACAYEQLNSALRGTNIGETIVLTVVRTSGWKQFEKKISLTSRQAHFCDTGLIA